MKKIIYTLVLLVFYSCREDDKEHIVTIDTSQLVQVNDLVITKEGDSLENGLWKYNNELLGISKEGKYRDGFKIGKWTYKTLQEEKTIEWTCFNKSKVKFNYPKYLKIPATTEYPVLFIGDIDDNDDKTYIALLEYDLKKMKLSIYDYLYQNNYSPVGRNTKRIKEKIFKKYIFKNIELYTVIYQERTNDVLYETTSYIYEVNGYVYDFTYRDLAGKIDKLKMEVFRDMLYSMESNRVDLFTYNTGRYLKKENIVFE